MNRHTLPVHVLAWAALWGLWVFVSRHNHPDLRLNAVASALLVATSAAAVHANHLGLIPRLWRRRRFAASGAALLLVMGLLALACTAAFHVAYDLLCGPDPARFGFLTNLAIASALLAFHVAAVAIGVRVFRPCPPPAAPVSSAAVSGRTGGWAVNPVEALAACAGDWRGVNILHDPNTGKPDESPTTVTVTPVVGGRSRAELDRLLAGDDTDPDNARLAKRLRKQWDHLLRLLDRDAVDATNNLAERELRPAVIARELSAGNRTEAGAETHAVLASVLRTCRRLGRHFLVVSGESLRRGPGHVVRLLPEHSRAPVAPSPGR